MHSWDRLTSLCGLGCKVFWTPWAQEDKYNTVNRFEPEPLDDEEPVTSEPAKPIWTDLHISAPIVRNKSGSMGNIKTGTGAGYEKLSVGNLRTSSSTAILNEKRNSKTELNGSITNINKALMKSDKEDISGSRASLAEEQLHVSELVTTV